MVKTVEFFGNVFGAESVATFNDLLSTLSLEQMRELKEAVMADIKVAKESDVKAKADAKALSDAEQAKIGKAYAETLSVGDSISWTMADGSVKTGTVGETKDGAKTLHIILDKQFVEAGKEADRYVSFDKIVVPAGFTVETDEIA